MEDLTRHANFLRLLTLTLADDGQPLAERTDRLLAAYRALRKSDLWRAHVRGAVAVVEVTMGRTVRHWHVHLHVLFDGDYLPHPHVKAEWYKATGDSYIVHLKAIHGRKAAARYVAAYIGKPVQVASWSDDECCEYAAALHGRRLLSTSGTFHNPDEDEDNKPDVPPPSTHLCSVHAVHHAEQKGCEYTRHAADILSRLSPALAMALDRPVQHTDATLPPADGREVAFALEIMRMVDAAFPSMISTADAEVQRRHFFSLPPPTAPPRERQCQLQDQSGW